MKEWEITLELLRQRGWDYGYVKCLDTEAGGEIYSVNLGRGTERLSVIKGTIEEAVTAINRLAEKVDGMALPKQELVAKAFWPLLRVYQVLAF
jgi:hypothetical protein